MACYISTLFNRSYAALEASFGLVPGIGASNRFNALRLAVRHAHEAPVRRDKTGSRTRGALPGRLRRRVDYELETYLYGRPDPAAAPRVGPLFHAGFGLETAVQPSGSIASVNGAVLAFTQAHGLLPGSAISVGSDVRFVASVPDAQTVTLNAPLSAAVASGTQPGGATVYSPAQELKSVSLFDFWEPATTTQRIVCGAAVDSLEIRANGDFHEFYFAGPAADLIASTSFTTGQGGLQEFPAEPANSSSEDAPIPGHLGQLWIGAAPDRLLTVTKARVRLDNNVRMRVDEFGEITPHCLVPGPREVTVDLEVFSKDASAFHELHASAMSRLPVSFLLQLGEQQGQLCGVYIPALIPAVPEFLDEGSRQLWRMRGSIAIGTLEDEIHVAFA